MGGGVAAALGSTVGQYNTAQSPTRYSALPALTNVQNFKPPPPLPTSSNPITSGPSAEAYAAMRMSGGVGSGGGGGGGGGGSFERNASSDELIIPRAASPRTKYDMKYDRFVLVVVSCDARFGDCCAV